MRTLARFFRRNEGAAAIEFAIVGNVFIMFLMAICYLGIMYWDSASLDWAVDRGVRLAILNKAVTQSQIAAAVNGYLTSVGMSNATVQYSVAASSGVNVATINATMTREYTVPLISHYNMTFTSTASVPQ